MLQSFDKKVPVWLQRLRVMEKKGVRKQGKKHATGRRNAAIKRRLKGIRKAKIATNNKLRKRFTDAARAYWRGEANEHP